MVSQAWRAWSRGTAPTRLSGPTTLPHAGAPAQSFRVLSTYMGSVIGIVAVAVVGLG